MRARVRAPRSVQVASHDSAGEVQAREVVQRSRGPSGRFDFTRVTAEPAGDARFHVDAEAETLARLVNANAVTYGRDVFIPPARYAPGTQRGDALIAHELTHVAQAPVASNALFRDGPPLAHYPTEDEQKQIESILGRHTSAPQPVAPTPDKPTPAQPETKIVDTGKHLTQTEIQDQVEALRAPFELALRTKFITDAPPTKKTVKDLNEAGVVSEKARTAIYAKFGAYIDEAHRFTLTKDDKPYTDTLRKNQQVRVTLASDNSDIDVFIPNILESFSPESSEMLAPLDDASKNAVEIAFTDMVHRDASLLPRVEIAHLNALGGRYNTATRTYSLTPFSSDPYGSAVHELLHASTHPTFSAAFGDEKIPNEGFTEYFTRQVAGVEDRTGNYEDNYGKIVQLRNAMFDGFGADSPEESLRRAYFKGEIELIGWRPNTKFEDLVVKKANPAQKPWDTATGKAMNAPRVAHGRAQLEPHDNLLGAGYYFHAKGDGTFSMRYARVFHAVDPYSRTRLLAVGQLEGSPTRFGGDLGLGIEHQNTWGYLGAALEGTASAAHSGAPDLRLGAEVSAELGLRLWHRVRLGVDGFVLFQMTNPKGVDGGAGLKVGVEF
jgi:hypothetical protein